MLIRSFLRLDDKLLTFEYSASNLAYFGLFLSSSMASCCIMLALNALNHNIIKNHCFPRRIFATRTLPLLQQKVSLLNLRNTLAIKKSQFLAI